MNKTPNNSEESKKSFRIRIAADDWKITPAADVKICQQPALNIPFPVLYAPRRLPPMDIWRLNDVAFPNGQIFLQKDTLC
jgi:hypothetical protein